MSSFRIFISVLLSVVAAFYITADAQNHAAGTLWALSGIGLTYESENSCTSFVRTAIQLEMAEGFLGRRGENGISCSITYNNVIGRTETGDGNEVMFHAGPGIMVGYCKDFRLRNESAPYGIAFGLQGRVGATIIYDRNINISISIAPVIGLHMTEKSRNISLDYYKYGLLRGLMPEIGITYRFRYQ